MKNKRNIFSEWINKIRNRNRPNEGIYYVSQRLRRTAKVVIPELNEINNNINNLTTNTAKKNESNTFTQNQKITGQLEIRKDADAVKIGNANENNACYVEFFNGNNRRGYVGHPRSSNNSFEINNGDNEIKLVGSAINVNSKRIVNVANPTANSDAVNKSYVDSKSTELTNEINSIKQKNTEQDSEITNIKQKNSNQDGEIFNLAKRVEQTNAIATLNKQDIRNLSTKNTEQDNRITTLESKTSGITILYKDIVIEFPVGTRWNIGDGKSINGDVIPGKPIFMNTFYYGAWLPNNVRYGLTGGMGWLFGFFNYPRNNGLTFYYSCVNPYQTKGWDSIPLFESERSITFRIYFIPNTGIREIDLEPTILNFNEIETVVIGEQ